MVSNSVRLDAVALVRATRCGDLSAFHEVANTLEDERDVLFTLARLSAFLLDEAYGAPNAERSLTYFVAQARL